MNLLKGEVLLRLVYDVKMDLICRLLACFAMFATSFAALDETIEDPVGISFLDCAGASILAKLPNGQEELTIYTSLPEVRLGFPQKFLDQINGTYSGDHYQFLSDNQFILDNRPLYGDAIGMGDLMNYSVAFLVDDDDIPARCGGCFYQALVQDASYEHGCPDDINIDVDRSCVRTSFQVDWIRPSELDDEGNFVPRTDVTLEGNAPGDQFNPGSYRMNYKPANSGSGFEECSFYVNLNANCTTNFRVRTIIGSMGFLSARVGSSADSVDQFCPREFGSLNISKIPRAIANCIYDQYHGPVWDEPAELADCLQGISIDERFTLILERLSDIQNRLKQKEQVPDPEIIEVGLAIDSFSRLGDDSDDDEVNIIEKTATLLRELILLNVTSEEITNVVLSVVNNFFAMDDDDDDDESSSQNLNNILTSLETQARNQIASGQNYTGVEENVALFNVVLDNMSKGDAAVTLSFGNFKSDISQSDGSVIGDLDQSDLRVTGDRIDAAENEIITSLSLPRGIQNFTAGESLMVSFFLYRNGSLFRSSGRAVGNLGPSVRQAVGSQVIATIVHNMSSSGRPFPSTDQLVTTFTPIMVSDENEQVLQDRICAFWNSSGRFWSTDGCTLSTPTSAPSSRVVCQCTHATSFAILVNIEEQSLVFTWISQVGSTVSAFALLITIFSVLSVRKLNEKTPWRVHLNLMFSLLGLYLVFMFGADQTESRRVCIAITVLMHYFLLVAFMWMFFEGLLLYKLLVVVGGNSQLPGFMWYSSLTAWGLPVFPAIAPVVMQYATDELVFENFYELQEYCFLKADSAMIFVGLIGVMGAIMAFNLVIFIMIVFRLTRPNSAAQDKSKGRLFFTFVSIVVLFGLTWTVGFFAIRDASYKISIAFAALNAFQGFFLFLLFGVREKEILRLWATPCLTVKKKRSASSKSGSSKKTGTRKSQGSTGTGSRSNPAFSNASTTE